MKEFSNKWRASKRPSKQRKWRYNAPRHLRSAMLSAHLSKDLRKRYGRRGVPLRRGDEVKIVRGGFKKKTGKILELNADKAKVFIGGIQRTKKDGTKVNVPIDPSNLMITSLDLEDKKRMISISKEKSEKKEEKKQEMNREEKKK